MMWDRKVLEKLEVMVGYFSNVGSVGRCEGWFYLGMFWGLWPKS